MHPLLIVAIAIFLPLAMALLLVGPLYAGLCVGLWLLYGAEAAAYLRDPSYVIGAYDGLFRYWSAHREAVDFMAFTLPVFGPPLLGAALGILCFFLLVRYIRNIFILLSPG